MNWISNKYLDLQVKYVFSSWEPPPIKSIFIQAHVNLHLKLELSSRQNFQYSFYLKEQVIIMIPTNCRLLQYCCKYEHQIYFVFWYPNKLNLAMHCNLPPYAVVSYIICYTCSQSIHKALKVWYQLHLQILISCMYSKWIIQFSQITHHIRLLKYQNKKSSYLYYKVYFMTTHQIKWSHHLVVILLNYGSLVKMLLNMK